MNDEIVIRELKGLDLMEALKLWRISFNAEFSVNFDTKEILIILGQKIFGIPWNGLLSRT
ncbi:hypothetical protein [Clostridium algidicarnis]|uniref:Acetyltransferase n=1 Tax=Clostridium algidicarnis TaxID=37659 RepID=A0ABS6C302_9CLOT|nr:hypothetical protein [Clostridium algidicarnis]MBB6698153.1 hypothetical protein [Clostridium algidicarnis]MBU3219802.1 hypothetical protein [Clostridium algidicarnis]